MSYLSWKYKVAIPDWLYKVALLVVATRLTMAPWLSQYQGEFILGVHWTLIVYPLVLGLIWLAIKYNPATSLLNWFLGVFIHVVALLVTTETSYVLVAGYPDFANLSYAEAILLALNWLVLAGVYLWRAQLSGSTHKLYRLAAIVLVTGATLIHLDISVVSSPFFEYRQVGGGVVNWLFLQWAVPALTLYSFIYFSLIDEKRHKLIYLAAGILGFMFVNGEIRALFNQGFIMLDTPIKQAELYTYSIVWLAISTCAIFLAQRFDNSHWRNAGFIGLALVILKAFGIDMAHLEGLYRALSFIGLGLCLVGIGWLFQKLQRQPLAE